MTQQERVFSLNKFASRVAACSACATYTTCKHGPRIPAGGKSKMPRLVVCAPSPDKLNGAFSIHNPEVVKSHSDNVVARIISDLELAPPEIHATSLVKCIPSGSAQSLSWNCLSRNTREEIRTLWPEDAVIMLFGRVAIDNVIRDTETSKWWTPWEACLKPKAETFRSFRVAVYGRIVCLPHPSIAGILVDEDDYIETATTAHVIASNNIGGHPLLGSFAQTADFPFPRPCPFMCHKCGAQMRYRELWTGYPVECQCKSEGYTLKMDTFSRQWRLSRRLPHEW